MLLFPFRYCPNAMILLITNPLNSLVPVYDKVYKRMGIDAGRKIIGLTILDTIRSATFIGEYLGISPDFCSIPVVGGHAGTTIIPLLSQLQSGYISEIDVPGITKRIQYAGDEVVMAKEGCGSATLAMAYAAASFTMSVLRAMDGEANVIEPGFIRQNYRECKYFSSLLRLGMNGVEEPIPLPKRLTSFEKKELNAAIPILVQQAEKGIEYANNADLYNCFIRKQSHRSSFERLTKDNKLPTHDFSLGGLQWWSSLYRCLIQNSLPHTSHLYVLTSVSFSLHPGTGQCRTTFFKLGLQWNRTCSSIYA